MKKTIMLSVSFMCIIILFSYSAWSQEQSSTDEFTLEEIIVTSEKREVNVQEVPASVVAISGVELTEEGKITASQMLENIPNLDYGEQETWKRTMGTPAAAISIRGLRYKQTSDGFPPSATATYADGIFQGAGGTYDVDRIEVLRGPQGTLYGRSATGGVVSFYTKNPILEDFSGNASAEIGTANLKNVNAAINIPVGDSFAMRFAGHWLKKDGYFDNDGNNSETREGRVKFRYQPSEALQILLTLNIFDFQGWSGGYQTMLTEDNEIDYYANEAPAQKSAWQRTTQAHLEVDADVGIGDLTYLISQRQYDDADNWGDYSTTAQSIQTNLQPIPEENYHYQELRLASDDEGPLSWLIGANYYYADYERSQTSLTIRARTEAGGPWDPDPNSENAPIFSQEVEGDVTNFGLFTEETFEVSDRLRLTAGLRYDNTEIRGASAFYFNKNVNIYNNSLNPADYVSGSYDDTLKYDNVTYKARIEYDLTPDNMLYFLTATGFQPGDIRLQLAMVWPAGATSPSDVLFYPLPYDEEKLTSYEVGVKNRFLDNKLQLNGDIFYYDYEGYRHTISIGTVSSIPFLVVTPLRMFGAEVEAEWVITPLDRVTASIGWLDAKITDYPMIEAAGASSEYYMVLDRVPGSSQLRGNISYEHSFTFPNGSSLVPRAELRYTHGLYLDNLSQEEVENGLKPLLYQDSYVLGNINCTWTSPNSMYSVSGYVRNITDEEYLTEATLSDRGNTHEVTVGDPRTWGLSVSVKF